MSYFGFEHLRENLVGNGIHTLENILTLETSLRIFFEGLEIWFEAIVRGFGIFIPRTEGMQGDENNTYAIGSRHQSMIRSCRDNPVTLTSQHPDLPLPNPTFLAIHAACCGIAHLSGAINYINNTLDGMRDIAHLGSDF